MFWKPIYLRDLLAAPVAHAQVTFLCIADDKAGPQEGSMDVALLSLSYSWILKISDTFRVFEFLSGSCILIRLASGYGGLSRYEFQEICFTYGILHLDAYVVCCHNSGPFRRYP